MDTISRRPLPLALVALAWLGLVASTVIAIVLESRLESVGRTELTPFPEDAAIFVAPILSAAIVGSALALRHPRHPVGWLFLALALVIDWSGVLEGYVAYGAVARPGSLPAADFLAVVADGSFISWLMVLSFILLLTPEGWLETRAARLAALAALVGGVVAFGAFLFEPYRGDFAEFGTIENPLAIEGWATGLRIVTTTALIVLHLGLLAGAGMLLLRFRRAAGTDRRKLRWLALAAIPFPVLVIGAYVAATLDNDVALALAAGGFVAVIPIGAAIAIERDHLYDVDSLLSKGLTYSLLTAGLVACYAVVVLFVGQALGDFGGDSQVPAVIATLVTVSVALPARRYLQEAIDRRFNRRQFEAVAVIRQFVKEPEPGIAVEQALRNALDDPAVRVAYWIDNRERWVDEAGNAATPAAGGITVTRRGTTIAVVGYDHAHTGRRIVDAAVAEARPEIENARLRAAVALQLVEVRESRARIVAAQAAERRKIERNLHDGAQQRLLGVAFQLRAAQGGAGGTEMRATLDRAITELQCAVAELRDLANGLHPTVLSDGGLAAALDDLADRVPIDVRLDVTADRFAAPVEETAWFIICEGLTNAVKHAAATIIEVSASREGGHLCLRVEDDGQGGADPLGNGLRGIADRAEAAGGWLTVSARRGGGTVLQAELPCAR